MANPKGIRHFRSIAIRGVIALAAFGIHFQATADSSSADCASQGGPTPICGVKSPEDITPTADGKRLFVSEIGVTFDDQMRLQVGPGKVTLLDPATGERRTLFPAVFATTGKADWGEPGCENPGAAFSPAGIHLSTRPDGKRQLLAVNYAPHVSVEMFEVDDEATRPMLSWRGCVRFPDSVMLNDVAALPTGGFVTTVIRFGDDDLMSSFAKAEKGLNTGFVMRWRPELGADPLPGSIMPLPNGIQVSGDSKAVFVASSRSAGEVRKIDMDSGTVLGSVKVARPDNLSWGKDGKLIVATGPAAPADCKSEGGCPARFEIIAIDPATMASETVRTHVAAQNANQVSVVAEAGDDYFLGSAVGDRILKISRKP